jgi:predicted dehydrogenase
MNRRDFIKAGAVATGTVLTSFPLTAKQDKIKLAILGTGNWGTEVILKSALACQKFEIVALCDVNAAALNRASSIAAALGGAQLQLFSDYRKMYEMKGLEAVAIATPTHWHALQFIAACANGLHVFLEKPISYDIREGQAMLEAHLQAKNIVQVDFPRVMTDINSSIKSAIEGGEVGKIFQVTANINHHEGELIEKAIPSTFDFDAFCGPASKSNFLCEGGDIPMWRSQYNFSRGIMFDWGIHYIHNARQVLGLDIPDQVMAIGGITRNKSHDNPDHLEVRYDFNGLPVCWSHKTWGYTSPLAGNDYGIYYFGDKATIFAGDMGWEMYSSDGHTKVIHGDIRFNPGNPEVWQKYLDMTTALFQEFAAGIIANSNERISNTLEDAFKTTATVIYGDMAYRLKAGLSIDKSTMNISNHNEAQQLMRRPYRSPYQHPYPA